jgi:hypothetical protein
MMLEGATARRAADHAVDDEEAALEVPLFPVPPLDLVVPTWRKARPMASVTPPALLTGSAPGEDADD